MHVYILVFCTEQNNAKFALSIEPNNEALQAYAAHVAQLHSKNLPTVITRFLWVLHFDDYEKICYHAILLMSPHFS